MIVETLIICKLHFEDFFNPKRCGGVGSKWPAGLEIACHFSQNHAMVTKILDFIQKHLNYKVLRSFLSRIFASIVFFILTLVTSNTFWGQSMILSNLKFLLNISAFNEILFVELGWKLEHLETTMRKSLLNWCHLVSISKNVMFYVFLVVRIY